jgi:hypothetical protein
MTTGGSEKETTAVGVNSVLFIFLPYLLTSILSSLTVQQC